MAQLISCRLTASIECAAATSRRAKARNIRGSIAKPPKRPPRRSKLERIRKSRKRASLAVYADMKEGFAYLKQQPLVLALGITHAIMMAGVVSANVVLVALANDILHAGPRGLGFLEAGWAIGAIIGGLIASQLPHALRMPLYVAACAGLAAGHPVTSFVPVVLPSAVTQILF